jgi:hypothetical protein
MIPIKISKIPQAIAVDGIIFLLEKIFSAKSYQIFAEKTKRGKIKKTGKD